MFTSIFCLALAAQFIQGSGQCLRTNSNPSRDCTNECTLRTGCSNAKKKCLCDGNCGYSCVNPRMRCSKPRARLRNGKIIFKSHRFNETQRAVCNAGFKLSGSPIRRCRANGFWDGRRARCRRPQKNCKDPGKQGLLLRTTGERKSFKPGTKLDYYCPHKFTLRGSRYLVCKRDGTWSASLPQCIVPKCRRAVLPAHTKVFKPRNWISHRDYGTRFTLSCDYGYTSAQRGELVCDPPGWRLEPSSFKCFPKSCPDPGTPRNGYRKGLFRFGEKVYYTCDKCYKLKGPSYRQCQADQKWSDSLPTCEFVTCSFLQNPTNGYLTFNSQQCGSTVQYHCDYGYHLIGSSRRRCQSDGTWSGNEPTCESQSCADPGTPNKGSKRGTGFYVGQTVQFSCDQCYQLKGSASLRCQADLSWSAHRPTCEVIKCSNLPPPKNGQKLGLSVYHTHCGRFVEFKCNPGYRLSGSSRTYCQSNGKWSRSPPTCLALRTNQKRTTQSTSKPSKKPATTLDTTLRPTISQYLTTTAAFNSSCGRPLLPPQAKIRLHKGKLLLISCKQNYVTLSPGRMWCNQKWHIIKNATCLAKRCSDPGEPKNGYKHGLSYFIDDVVTFTCAPCYWLDGESKATCLKNRSWSYSQPKCVLTTCPPPVKTGQAKVDHISAACGAKAIYTCKDTTLTMLGSGEKVCNQSGMWEGPEPKCIDPNLNIAFRKPASMSSHDKRWGDTANVAVDGKRNTHGFCHTYRELGPWWKVDLLREETVSTVIVVNRRDCCIKRLNGFKVSVGNSAKDAESNSECGGRLKAVSGENIIQCSKPLKGRYVFVYLPKNKRTILALIEVEVYSKKLEE